ncbi:MAG: beta-galactosidase [Bifidobacteriaceae bacterium]|jgi:beta-galactosidase|nr:beta-galactosidase [Bifidobacteriaceae bacterium]
MAKKQVDEILFGAAYYDEYLTPKGLDRVDTDMKMMRAAGMNLIRIAESTWSTCEPQPGVFDFSHVDRALDAAERAGIKVIVGTPTYAVPTWLVKMHPDVLAVTPNGPGKYGARQIMDIVNPAYKFYGERVIRKLVAHVAERGNVIGFQVDNETKYYDSVSEDMQALFIKSLRTRFHDDLNALNATFGLDYWSNRINAWEDFPDLTGSINESLRAAFDHFRRSQVAEFLAWQAGIVREYARDDQFVTHNFDFDWAPGWSYGVQPALDHFESAAAVDIAGTDIYHPTEDALTGKEIAFGGDMMRSVKDGQNYIVLETEAQGQNGWLPYPGQLRLQAYSHLASGADGVEYWHWHSIHNSFETYWKGVLSHDMEPNPTYEEAGVFGREIQRIGGELLHLRKHNKVAMMVSNDSLSALEWFHLESGFPYGGTMRYNDIVRKMYDELFEMNVECDMVPVTASAEKLSQYSMVLTPALYSAPASTLEVLRAYVQGGGHLVSTLRSFVTDENVTVWTDRAPHSLTDVFGMTYNQFTRPQNVPVKFGSEGSEALADIPAENAQALIELLVPAGANAAGAEAAGANVTGTSTFGSPTQVLAAYDHYAWKGYAAITRHAFGSGDAEYIGTVLSDAALKSVLREAVENAGIEDDVTALGNTVRVRRGTNAAGKSVTYFLNYSAEPVSFSSPVAGRMVLPAAGNGTEAAEVTSGAPITAGAQLSIAPWNLQIVIGK